MSVPETCSLDDVAEVTSGQSAPQGSDKFSDEGTPFIRAGSLEPLLAGKSQSSLELIGPSVAADHRMRLFPEGTVVFAKSGMSAKLGRVYCLSAPAFVVSHLAAIIPSPRLDSRFLRRWFECNSPSRLIPNESYPSISLKAISELEVPLPPLPEQKRIAAILDAADALRAKRRESIEQLDSLVQATFLEMFGDPVTNPKGWPCMSIGDALARGILEDMQDGNHGERHPKVADFTDTGIPFVMANCLGGGHLDVSQAYRLPQGWLKRLRVGFAKAGDVLLSHKGTIGETAVVSDELRLVILSPQVTYYRPSETLSARFLASMFSCISYGSLLAKEAKQSTRAYIGLTRQKRLPLVVPPPHLQTRFASIVESIEQQKARLKAHLAELDTLFACLQSRAFSGELVA